MGSVLLGDFSFLLVVIKSVSHYVVFYKCAYFQDDEVSGIIYQFTVK